MFTAVSVNSEYIAGVFDKHTQLLCCTNFARHVIVLNFIYTRLIVHCIACLTYCFLA